MQQRFYDILTMPVVMEAVMPDFAAFTRALIASRQGIERMHSTPKCSDDVQYYIQMHCFFRKLARNKQQAVTIAMLADMMHSQKRCRCCTKFTMSTVKRDHPPVQQIQQFFLCTHCKVHSVYFGITTKKRMLSALKTRSLSRHPTTKSGVRKLCRLLTRKSPLSVPTHIRVVCRSQRGENAYYQQQVEPWLRDMLDKLETTN